MSADDPKSTNVADPGDLEGFLGGQISRVRRQHTTCVNHSIPANISKFPIKKSLGRGGMGEVFLGTHPEFEIPVAIKVIRSEYAQEASYIERFQRESKVAIQINHPNVVRTYDAGCDQGNFYLVQEYVDGGTLEDKLKTEDGGQHPLDTEEAVSIVTQLASALVEIERCNIVHRDIKPANVLLTKSGIPKIADLGIAKHCEHQPEIQAGLGITKVNKAVGSPAYMAPEQLRNAANVNHQADIFALGVTFLELLTGEAFYSSQSRDALLAQRQKQVESIDPQEAYSYIPTKILRIIRRMTEHNTTGRYATAQELLKDLEKIQTPLIKRHSHKLSLALATVATLLICLTAFILALPQEVDALSLADEYLNSGNSAKAKEVLIEETQNNPNNLPAWYALGLCHFDQANLKGMNAVHKRLSEQKQGNEYAAHIKTLILIKKEQYDAALKLIDQWATKAMHPLPFLLAKSMVMVNRQDYASARECIEQALDYNAVFKFQRTIAFNSLGKSYAAAGMLEEAQKIFSRAFAEGSLETDTLPSELYTNYATTLMEAGKYKEAAKTVDTLLKQDPKNKVARYLHQRAIEKANRSAKADFKNTMELLNQIESQLQKDEAAALPHWQSQAIIISTFMEPPSKSALLANGLGETRFLVDTLVKQIQEADLYPVVNRDMLETILREHQISLSKLSAQEARLAIGRFLPSSVLITLRMSSPNQLDLKVIDMATSQYITMKQVEIPNLNESPKAIDSALRELMKDLQSHFDLRGSVKEVSQNYAEITIGKYHGVKPDTRLVAFAPDHRTLDKTENKSTRQELVIREIKDFTCIAEASDTESLRVGMLVRQKHGKANK